MLSWAKNSRPGYAAEVPDFSGVSGHKLRTLWLVLLRPCQGVDQVRAIGTTPSRHQVVADYCRILLVAAWKDSAGMASKNKVPIPAYQQPAGVINSSNQGSTTLRNIPDVAAEADTDQYSCWDGTCGGGWGGTSYASPRLTGQPEVIPGVIPGQKWASGRSLLISAKPVLDSFRFADNSGVDGEKRVYGE